jgi:hypothetical protein
MGACFAVVAMKGSAMPHLHTSGLAASSLVAVALLAALAAAPAADDTVIGPWQMKPDPPADKIAGPFNLKGSIPVAFMGSVVFPTGPSPYVAVTPGGVKGQTVLQVYDLRTLKPVGQPLQAKFDAFTCWPPVLSPDGAYLAAVPKDRDKAGVEVWTTATGKSTTIEVDDTPKIKIGLVDFVGKGELFTMKHEHQFPDPSQTATYQVWDVKTGKDVSTFSYNLCFHGKWGGFSPGRKFLLLEETDGARGYHLLSFDIARGKQIGVFEFQGKKEPWGQAAGIAFSPDGEEVAMLWRLGQRPPAWGKLLCWDVRTGKKLVDHLLGYDPPQIDSLWGDGGPRTLQWLPDKSGWLLFNHLLVDRESGAIVYRISPEPGFSGAIVERRFLDRDHVTTLEGTFEKQLRVIALPREQIDAAVKKAREKASPK